jgi:hypothetical protein
MTTHQDGPALAGAAARMRAEYPNVPDLDVLYALHEALRSTEWFGQVDVDVLERIAWENLAIRAQTLGRAMSRLPSPARGANTL